MRRGRDDADRPAVADDERGPRAGAHVVDRGERAGLVLGERLAAGEAEARAGAPPRRPAVRLLALDVLDEAPLPAAAVRLGEAVVDAGLEAERRRDDLRRLARAHQPARPHRLDARLPRDGRERARLLAPAVGERRVEPPGE